MKKLKFIINAISGSEDKTSAAYTALLWQLICYSPKMPLRLSQQQLLNEAQPFHLSVYDPYFSYKDLIFNGFIWGSGATKVYLTHGWGSKAADLAELITALKEIPDTQIIAFDAPGNGSSEAELTNVPLYIAALKKVIAAYGQPQVVIGHSAGTLANIVALNDMGVTPELLVGITPLIKLRQNFEVTMSAVKVPEAAQNIFFEQFEEMYGSIDELTAGKLYHAGNQPNYWVAYDEYDRVSPFEYINEFLIANPNIKSQSFIGSGHDKILKDEDLIARVVKLVSQSASS